MIIEYKDIDKIIGRIEKLIADNEEELERNNRCSDINEADQEIEQENDMYYYDIRRLKEFKKTGKEGDLIQLD